MFDGMNKQYNDPILGEVKSYIEQLEISMKRIIKGQKATSVFADMLSTVGMADIASDALKFRPDCLKG